MIAQERGDERGDGEEGAAAENHSGGCAGVGAKEEADEVSSSMSHVINTNFEHKLHEMIVEKMIAEKISANDPSSVMNGSVSVTLPEASTANTPAAAAKASSEGPSDPFL